MTRGLACTYPKHVRDQIVSALEAMEQVHPTYSIDLMVRARAKATTALEAIDQHEEVGGRP